MALQLTGAAKAVRLPTCRFMPVVSSVGLTAIDTATESLAYYGVQVEKFPALRNGGSGTRKKLPCGPYGRQKRTDRRRVHHPGAIRNERRGSGPGARPES
jgi:hypothetical protein